MFSQICAVLGVGVITAAFEVLRYLKVPLNDYITRKEREIKEEMKSWASEVHQVGKITLELEDKFWEIISTYVEDVDEPKRLYISMRNFFLISGLLFIFASFLSTTPYLEVYAYITVAFALLTLSMTLISFIKIDGKNKMMRSLL